MFFNAINSNLFVIRQPFAIELELEANDKTVSTLKISSSKEEKEIAGRLGDTGISSFPTSGPAAKI